MMFMKILMIVCLMLKVQSLQEMNKPHIIFMVADYLGWNDVSWHNHNILTPNLRDLALGGVRLNRSYVHPTCSPTRSALLTGRYPFTMGSQEASVDDHTPSGLTINATMLPQALKAAGYSTHAVGKWHLGYCSWAYTPTYRGFDTFYGYYNSGEDYLTHMRRFKGSSKNGRGSADDLVKRPKKKRQYLDLRNNTEPVTNQDGTYSTHMFASYIENLLESRNPADPMFLYLPFQSVHTPLMVPENYTTPYMHINDTDRRIYLGMVTALDEAVGKVVDALKRTGHYENSVIVFTSDNGGSTKHGARNWPLRGEKNTLWEGGTKGVAFVHSPLLPNPGTISDELIHVTDWFPTLVGLAGGEAPSDTDGFDQWKAITGNERSPRIRMVYSIVNTKKLKASVRIGDYKLIAGNPGMANWVPPPELETPAKNSPYRKYLSEKLNLRAHHVLPDSKNKSLQKNRSVLHSQIKESQKQNVENRRLGLKERTTTWGSLMRKYFRGSDWLNVRPQALDIFYKNLEIRMYNISDSNPTLNPTPTPRNSRNSTVSASWGHWDMARREEGFLC